MVREWIVYQCLIFEECWVLSDGERAFAVASEYSGDGSGGDGTNGPSCFISPSSTLSSWETERSSPGKEETFQIWKSCEFFIDQRLIPVEKYSKTWIEKRNEVQVVSYWLSENNCETWDRAAIDAFVYFDFERKALHRRSNHVYGAFHCNLHFHHIWAICWQTNLVWYIWISSSIEQSTIYLSIYYVSVLGSPKKPLFQFHIFPFSTKHLLLTNRLPQLFGHSRSPSMEFKELTKKDAQISLAIGNFHFSSSTISLSL